MNPRRGHESKDHLEAKEQIVSRFDETAWSAFAEQCFADIVVLHHASGFVAAIEVESTPRNVLRNIGRNAACGCMAVAVVSLSKRYMNQISNLVLRHFTTQPVRVFPGTDKGLRKLVQWLENIADTQTQNLKEKNNDT